MRQQAALTGAAHSPCHFGHGLGHGHRDGLQGGRGKCTCGRAGEHASHKGHCWLHSPLGCCAVHCGARPAGRLQPPQAACNATLLSTKSIGACTVATIAAHGPTHHCLGACNGLALARAAAKRPAFCEGAAGSGGDGLQGQHPGCGSGSCCCACGTPIGATACRRGPGQGCGSSAQAWRRWNSQHAGAASGLAVNRCQRQGVALLPQNEPCMQPTAPSRQVAGPTPACSCPHIDRVTSRRCLSNGDTLIITGLCQLAGVAHAGQSG